MSCGDSHGECNLLCRLQIRIWQSIQNGTFLRREVCGHRLWAYMLRWPHRQIAHARMLAAHFAFPSGFGWQVGSPSCPAISCWSPHTLLISACAASRVALAFCAWALAEMYSACARQNFARSSELIAFGTSCAATSVHVSPITRCFSCMFRTPHPNRSPQNNNRALQPPSSRLRGLWIHQRKLPGCH